MGLSPTSRRNCTRYKIRDRICRETRRPSFFLRCRSFPFFAPASGLRASNFPGGLWFADAEKLFFASKQKEATGKAVCQLPTLRMRAT